MTTTGDVNALAASQDYLTAASRWRTLQLVVVVIIPAAAAVWATVTRRHDLWLPLLGFAAAFADATLFNWLISTARYHAAQLSSEYDASLVAKTAARTRLVGGPSRDTIIRRSQSFARSATARRRAKGWHYSRIAELKSPIADLLYIRSDLSHDECVREPYVTFLFVVLAAGICSLVAIASTYNWNVGDIAANILFPSVPVAMWLGRELIDQLSALRRKRTVRELVDDHFISEQINPHSPDDPLVMEREALHGMQFFFRATQPSLPGWFVYLRAEGVRETLEQVLDEYIDDAIQAGHGRLPQPTGDMTQG